MADKIKAVVLAAGKSTRMKSEISKVLHPILGKEIIRYLLDSLLDCGIAEPEDIVVVVGDNRAEIENAIGSRCRYARQQEQLGTAHALLSAAAQVAGPRRRPAGAGRGQSLHHRRRAAATDRRPPPRPGRTARLSARFSRAIRPLRPRRPRRAGAGPAHRGGKGRQPRASGSIREVNASIYLFDNRVVFPLLAGIGNDNAKKEYYLTDIIAMLRRENLEVAGGPGR